MVAVYTGTDHDFNTVAFGMPNLNTVNYLQNQFTMMDRSMFRDTSFIDRAYQVFHDYNGSEALSKARALLSMTDSLTDPNAIYYCKDLWQLQTANPMMQRYLMANPMAREWYQNNRLDGYNETYVDVFPTVDPLLHPDYTKVVDGIIDYESIDPDTLGYNPCFTVSWYFNDYDQDTTPLMFEDQVDIINSWEELERYLMYGEDDPTSPYGGSL